MVYRSGNFCKGTSKSKFFAGANVTLQLVTNKKSQDFLGCCQCSTCRVLGAFCSLRCNIYNSVQNQDLSFLYSTSEKSSLSSVLFISYRLIYFYAS